jgi:hypothetical protein
MDAVGKINNFFKRGSRHNYKSNARTGIVTPLEANSRHRRSIEERNQLAQVKTTTSVDAE